MSRKQIEIVVVGILIIGVIIYAGAGIVYAGVLSTGAERTLNNVVSQQESLNTSFSESESEAGTLGSATFNPKEAVTLVDRSVTSLQVAASMIDQDDSSLASEQRRLDSSRWLTLMSRSAVDRESARVGHARSALAAGRIVAADKVLDDRFWRALYTALGELDTLSNQNGSGDFTSAKSTLATVQSDVVQAVQQSTAPGLPPELHSLTVDFQTFVSDFGKQLDAQIAGDNAAVAQSQSSLDADRGKLGAYNVDKIASDIDAFYRPLIGRFNSEIAAATS